MKNTLLTLTLTLALAASAHGQYVVAIDSVDGGAFDNIANPASFDTLDEGATTSATFTENSFLETKFLNNTIGNVDVWKVGVANTAKDTSATDAWSGSRNAQTFTINVVGTPTAQGGKPGPRWRYIRSFNNGSDDQSNWSDITTGVNTLSITGGLSFDRYVGFQIAGTMNIDSFSHDYGTGVDTYSISAVPEPSSYALLAGLLASIYMIVRRRKISQTNKSFLFKTLNKQ